MSTLNKKILNIASKVLMGIVIAVTVFMMIFTIFSTLMFDKNDRNLFGTRFYIVLSDSMSPSENNKDDKIHFNAGDIVLIKNVDDPKALNEGDVIAFISQNKDNFGETVTHRIRTVNKDDKGNTVSYVTYGTNTGKDDEVAVKPQYVLGVYSGKLVKIGYFFQFLKSTPGYIICILIPFLILIIMQGVNTVRLFLRYRGEQTAAIEAEKAKIEEERKQNADMMQELMALKAQLEQQRASAQSAKAESGNEAKPEDK